MKKIIALTVVASMIVSGTAHAGCEAITQNTNTNQAFGVNTGKRAPVIVQQQNYGNVHITNKQASTAAAVAGVAIVGYLIWNHEHTEARKKDQAKCEAAMAALNSNDNTASNDGFGPAQPIGAPQTTQVATQAPTQVAPPAQPQTLVIDGVSYTHYATVAANTAASQQTSF